MTNDVETPSPRFTGIFIPAEILELEQLTPREIILLSWIDALYSKKHGGCFASNEYLANKLRVKPDTVTKSLQQLKSLGLVEQVSFNGRTRVIRAKLGKAVDKAHGKKGKRQERKSNADLENVPRQTRKKIRGGPGKKSYPDPEKNPASAINADEPPITTKKEKKKEKKDDGGTPPKPPASPDKKSSRKKKLSKDKPGAVERREAVHTTDTEHNKLFTEYGEHKLNAIYDKLNAAKLAKGTEYASDYHAILNWVANAVQNDQNSFESAKHRRGGGYIQGQRYKSLQVDPEDYADAGW